MATRVLITGGTGFIGSRLAERLLAEGAEVHVTSRRPRERVAPRSIRELRLDPADAEATRRLFAEVEPEVVFHLAGRVDSARRLDLVLPTLYGNVVSTVSVLLAAEAARCRRVIVPGSLEEPDPTETAALVPQSPYAIARWAASSYARMFDSVFGTPTVVVRLFMVYGPGQRDERKLVPSVIRSLQRDRAPELTSGSRRMDWIYIDDAVEALVAAADAPDLGGSTIDVGSGELHTIREVVETLMRLSGSAREPVFGALPDRPGEVVRVADLTAAQELLDWSPTVDLQEGLARTLAWFERGAAETPAAGDRVRTRADSGT